MKTPDYVSLDGTVTLYCGDCREILPQLSGVDAVVTDPPYGVDFAGKATKHTPANGITYTIGDCAEVGPEAVKIALGIADRGAVFGGNANAFRYPTPVEIGGVYCPSGAGLGRWGFTCFHCLLFYGKPPHGCTRPTVITSNERTDINGHPCPKPTGWMRWVVDLVSRDGETILDPFMGSGTTGVACVRLGRKFIGIEIDRGYFDIAVKRIEQAFADQALFVPQLVESQAELFAEVT